MSEAQDHASLTAKSVEIVDGLVNSQTLPEAGTYFPAVAGSPIVLTLHDDHDRVIDSIVGLVDRVRQPTVWVSVFGAYHEHSDVVSVSLLIMDGKTPRRVRCAAHAWLSWDEPALIELTLEGDTRWQNNRATPRADTSIHAVVAVAGEGDATRELPAQIDDLSASGARLSFAHDDATFAIRSNIFLRFAIGDELPLLVLCKIVGAERISDDRTMLRLAFLSLDDYRYHRLARFVSQLKI